MPNTTITVNVNTDEFIEKAIKKLSSKCFLIRCDNREILDHIRGYMSDGGGEYGLFESLHDHDIEFQHEDIRDEFGMYCGIEIKEGKEE